MAAALSLSQSDVGQCAAGCEASKWQERQGFEAADRHAKAALCFAERLGAGGVGGETVLQH